MDGLLVGDGGKDGDTLADCPASSWKLALLADDAASGPGTVLAAASYSLNTAEPPDAG